MRWVRSTPAADDGGIARLKQWAEINIAALYESHRQQRVRLTELETLLPPDPVSEKVTDKITDSLRDIEEHVCNAYDRVVVHAEAISAMAEQVRELQARVTALEQQPPSWLPKNRHVEL
jgi:hypothetical protein